MSNTVGSLYVISGPSGVGKGTVCKALLARDDSLAYSISATTRAMRPGEIDGVHYHFLTKEDFLSRVERGEFLEWATVYENYYGTLKSFVEEQLKGGKDVILEIDTEGARQVRKLMPEAVLIFLEPPSREELLHRLLGRETDSAEEIAKRQKCLDFELSQAVYYNYTVVNDEVERAVDEIRQIIARRHVQSQD